ncbi:MAG: hypothetical protein M5U34_38820 [Chloroflexi bacterium]|nr:hypothetical protein [Chloroflexota bacterium]
MDLGLGHALLIYAPLNSQRRFIQGVHVPLSILAAAGFVAVVVPWFLSTRFVRRLLTNPRYTAVKLSRFITAVFLLIMSLSNLYLWASVSTSAVIQQPDPLFRPADELARRRLAAGGKWDGGFRNGRPPGRLSNG